MPVSRSDPRRTTIIGVIGLVVGTIMIVLVLFAGNLGGGDKTQNSKTSFDAGPAEARATAIERDRFPLIFPDTATGSRPLVVHHVGRDPKVGWIAFDAITAPKCGLTWNVATQDFTDCQGRRIGADGGDLHHYPVTVDNDGHVVVDLSIDATTTTSS